MHRVGVKEEGVGGWGVGACNKKEERERERETEGHRGSVWICLISQHRLRTRIIEFDVLVSQTNPTIY